MGLPVKVAVLQKADRWCFGPFCFLLTVVRKLGGLFGARTESRPRNILFVKLAEQGSTVLAAPTLRRAVEMVGRENVYFLCFEENRFVLDMMEIIPPENVLTVSTESLFTMASGTLRVIGRMQRMGLDAAIDLEFLARFSAALTYLSGARLRVGMHAFHGEGPYRGDLMTHRIPYNPHLHTTQMFQVMVEALNAPSELFPTFNYTVPPLEFYEPSFRASAEELRRMEELIRKETGKVSLPRVILLNPNASDLLPLRRWPTNRYVELAKRLLAKFPEVYIAFTGAKEETVANEQLVREVGSERCFSAAGKTTLRELLALYTLCDVLVTNDSGPAHFASLTPIHVVTLFGPETPALFAAHTSRHVALWAGIACSPCVSALNNRQSACKNNLCMQAISVDQVFAQVCRGFVGRETDCANLR
ncbi:MAG: hypothetical protein JWQ71_1667 [Pedosphaera sp.]|nr:hypothetical protein [Pedosphaera sp.]